MAEFQFQFDLQLRLGTMALHLTRDTTAAALGLVGPSGAGKTTTLRIFAGLEQRAAGVLRLNGETWLDSASKAFLPAWQRQVGWVPQEALLFPQLTVQEQLAYSGAGDTPIKQIADLLELGPLLERRPRHLSGGERQRVALGRALTRAPRLLLLDEPFSALDRPRRLALIERLQQHCRDAGIPTLLVSHDERDIAAFTDEIWELRDGNLH